jgi:hypothetical protein
MHQRQYRPLHPQILIHLRRNVFRANRLYAVQQREQVGTADAQQNLFTAAFAGDWVGLYATEVPHRGMPGAGHRRRQQPIQWAAVNVQFHPPVKGGLIVQYQV